MFGVKGKLRLNQPVGPTIFLVYFVRNLRISGNETYYLTAVIRKKKGPKKPLKKFKSKRKSPQAFPEKTDQAFEKSAFLGAFLGLFFLRITAVMRKNEKIRKSISWSLHWAALCLLFSLSAFEFVLEFLVLLVCVMVGFPPPFTLLGLFKTF